MKTVYAVMRVCFDDFMEGLEDEETGASYEGAIGFLPVFSTEKMAQQFIDELNDGVSKILAIEVVGNDGSQGI